MKKLYIRTFGCQMNEYDSQVLETLLAQEGYTSVANVQEADVILFNTCSVRAHAEERALGNVKALRKLKEKSPEKVIGVIGCMAQNYGEKLIDEVPFIDLVCGTDRIWEIPAFVSEILSEGKKIVSCEETGTSGRGLKGGFGKKLKSYIAIMRGCNNFCSYCIVPYVRGRERSRKPREILDEARLLLDAGVKELTLLGQNVNSYGRGLEEEIDISGLLEELDRLPYKKRIRFLTSHPKDISPILIRAMRDIPGVCEHLHLPVQSGSDKVLADMNRGYTRSKYIDIVQRYYNEMPYASLTTDFIVGFPGELNEQFHQSLSLMSECEFDDSFIFKYSPRSGTKAVGLADDVPVPVKEERNNLMLHIQKELTSMKNVRLIGTKQEVLVESGAKKSDRQLFGRTRSHKKVVFQSSERLIGEFVTVKIKSTEDFTLIGELI